MFFSILERQALRRGDFASVEDVMAWLGDLWSGRRQEALH
jgi:hypothetical protein